MSAASKRRWRQDPRNRAAENARRTAKYANDPEYRERCLASCKAWYAANLLHRTQYRAMQYSNDKLQRLEERVADLYA